MEEIKIGDVVRLKSGSPKMTVREIENEVYITCVYWDEKLFKFSTLTVEADQLEKVD